MENTNGSEARVTRRGALRDLALAPDSYGLLLLLLVLDYVVLSVRWSGGWELITSSVFIGLTALLAFRTSHVRGRLLRAVRIAVLISVVASIVAAIYGGNEAKGIALILESLLVFTSPIAIVSRIIKHTRVTAQTILGAICIYLLIGLVFSYADFALQLVSGNPFFAQSGNHTGPDFVYFSFITMTTVGYGDLTPANGLPRTNAVLEALTGQIFLVVMVSRLVSMYLPTPGGRRALLRDGLADDADGVSDNGSHEDEVDGGP